MIKRAAIIVMSAVLLGVLGLLWAWRLWTGPGPVPPGFSEDTLRRETTLVRIPQGMTLTAAADTLAARGLLEHPKVLLGGARLAQQGRALRAGLYEIPYGSSCRELLRILTAGAALQVRVTVPEGLDAEGIATVMAEALDFPAEDFLASADSLVFAAAESMSLLGAGGMSPATFDSLLRAESSRHPRRFRWCEGHLAPDTYLFAEGTSAAKAARFLVATQWGRVDSVRAGSGSAGQLSLSPQDLLTLASIIEAEARRDDERPLIAAVYTNRLRKGRRLEADPTVAFILHKKGKRLFYRDLEVKSPFNTYRNKGLPPGPIGSPGLASLQAASRPDSTCEALFFVADGEGGHVFSRTAREHEAAVQEYRRIRSQDRSRRNN